MLVKPSSLDRHWRSRGVAATVPGTLTSPWPRSRSTKVGHLPTRQA